MRSLGLAASYLFEVEAVRTVLAEVAGPNLSRLGRVLDRIGQLAVVTPERFYSAGTFHASHVYGLDRRKLRAVMRRVCPDGTVRELDPLSLKWMTVLEFEPGENVARPDRGDT